MGIESIDRGSPPLVTRKKMKFDTLRLIADAIRSGKTTKKGIQQYTHISWASCCDTINALNRSGIITEDTAMASQPKPGRKTANYKFSDTTNLSMGIEITPSSLHCSIVNLGNTLLFDREYSLPETLNTMNVYRILRDTFYAALADSRVAEPSVNTVTFVLTGALDRRNLVWINSPKISSINNVDFHFFSSSLPYVRSVLIEHDTIARASSLLRANRSLPDSFALLHISDGVGLTVMDNGQFILGRRGLAGELGHVILPGYSGISPRACFCGQKGCLESYLSTGAILNHVNKVYHIPLETLSGLHEALNPEQERFLLDNVTELVLAAVIMVVNLFDPQKVYLGGQVIDTWFEPLSAGFDSALRTRTWQRGPEEVVFYKEGDTNPAYGGAINATQGIIAAELHEIVRAEPARTERAPVGNDPRQAVAT